MIGVLGAEAFGDDVKKLSSLEDAERAMREGEITVLIVGDMPFPSCDNTRDMVMLSAGELEHNFWEINPDVKIIFLSRNRWQTVLNERGISYV